MVRLPAIAISPDAIVNPDGSLSGSEFRISAGFGAASDVAFDGTNFFVVWCDDAGSIIRGRFVSPAGIPGTEITLNASSVSSDNPKSVTFDGSNYLVVWNDEIDTTGPQSWDVFGQLVSPAGALVGGAITITGRARSAGGDQCGLRRQQLPGCLDGHDQ